MIKWKLCKWLPHDRNTLLNKQVSKNESKNIYRFVSDIIYQTKDEQSESFYIRKIYINQIAFSKIKDDNLYNKDQCYSEKSNIYIYQMWYIHNLMYIWSNNKYVTQTRFIWQKHIYSKDLLPGQCFFSLKKFICS